MPDQTSIPVPRTQGISRPLRSEAGPLTGLAVPLVAGSASFTLLASSTASFGAARRGSAGRRVADYADLRHRLGHGQALTRIGGRRAPGVQRR